MMKIFLIMFNKEQKRIFKQNLEYIYVLNNLASYTANIKIKIFTILYHKVRVA